MAEIATLGLRVDGVSNIQQATDALSGFSATADKAEKSSGKFGTAATKASTDTKKSASGLAAPFEKLNSSISIATKSLLALGAASLGLAAVSRTLTGFEDSMAQVAAITRASTDELRAMREMAKSLGATTKFSASEAADGIRFLGMAGFSASESLASIPAVLNLATASAMGLADAADIATNIMSGFGIQAQNAANVADVLAAASSRSNTTVQQLGNAMSTVAPISAALGISLEDTAAAIGTLSDAGIQGERAGTAMRGALASLAGPTTQAQKVLKSLGLTVQDVNPQTNDLATVFGRLNEAGLNTAQAMTIFGREAASGALVLTQASARVGEFGQELRGAGGEAQRMADIMADSLAGDFKNLESAVESIIIAMGEAGLTSAMRAVIKFVTELALSASRLIETLGKVAGTIGSALAPAFNVIGHVLMTVARNADIAIGALAAFYAPAVLAGIAALTKALAVGLVGAIRAVTVAMMANPLGLLVKALATAITAIFIFRDDIQRVFGIDVPQAFKNMLMGAAGALDSAFSFYTGYVSSVWSLFTTLGENIATFFANVFHRVREKISEMVFAMAQEMNKLPFVNIETSLYVGPGDQGYKDVFSEATKAFEAGQKALGARDALVSMFSDDAIRQTGDDVFKEYTDSVNDLIGTPGGEGSGTGLTGATDALQKWLTQAGHAAFSARALTVAYLEGGEAITNAVRQQEIESQVLEHGEGARRAITAAIMAQAEATDRLDIAKQVNDLALQNKEGEKYLAVIAAQSKGHAAGRVALAAFNKEQALSALLVEKNADEVADLVALYNSLWDKSEGISRAKDAMGELNRLVESTRTSQEKYSHELERLLALRPYAQTAEQAEALERAIGNLHRENSEWISFTEDALERINKSFADMWKDVFDGSKNAFEGMKDGFKQMLAEMAHAAVTKPIMITLGNALMGTNNPGGIGDGGGIFGALRSGASWLSTGRNAYSAVAGLFGGGASLLGLGQAGGATLASTLGTGAIASPTFGAALQGGSLIPGLGFNAAGGGVGAGIGATGGAAGGASAGLAAIPVAGWIAAGMMAAGSAYDKGFNHNSIPNSTGIYHPGALTEKWFTSAFEKVGVPGKIANMLTGASLTGQLLSMVGLGNREPTTRRGQRTIADLTPGGDFSVNMRDDRLDAGAGDEAARIAKMGIDAANATFKTLGIDAAFDSFYAVMESSYKRDADGVATGGQLRVGDRLVDIGVASSSDMTKHGFGGWSGGDLLSRLEMDVRLSTLEAFQAVSDELPSLLATMLEGEDIRALSSEAQIYLSDSFNAVIAGASAFTAALQEMPFEYLRDISMDAAIHMVHFGGGLEATLASMSAYFDKFYSAEEKIEFKTNELTRSLEAAGLAMPEFTGSVDETLASYRQMVEGIDRSTEAGQRMYITAVQLGPAFAEVVDGMMQLQTAAAATARAAEDAAIAAQQAALKAQQDAWSALVQAGESAYAALSRSISAEKSRLQKEAEAIADALRGSIAAASATVNELTALTGRLTSTLQRMMSQGLDEGRNRTWAQDRIDRALSVARLTGVMPQGADFEHALQVVAQPSEGLFDSFEDYQADFLKTAHTISALNDIAGNQLTEEKRALSMLETQLQQSREWYDAEMMRLDEMLEIERKNLDIAMGTYETVLTIPQALERIAQAIGALNLVPEAYKGGSFNEQAYLEGKLAELAAGGIVPVDFSGPMTTDYLRDFMSQHGMTPEQHYKNYGQAEGIDDYIRQLRGYAVGTSYVPYDMAANIHQGEMIIDPRTSAHLRRYGIEVHGRGGADKETKDLLRQIVSRLDHLEAIDRHTYETARSNREMTERIQPVEVTNVVPTVAATVGA